MTGEQRAQLAEVVEALYLRGDADRDLDCRTEALVERPAALAAVVKAISILTGESAEEIADQLATFSTGSLGAAAAGRIIRRRVVQP